MSAAVLEPQHRVIRAPRGPERSCKGWVQEAALRAFRFFDGLRDANARPWLLAIVRNAAYSWMEKNRPADVVPFEDGNAPEAPAAAPRVELMVVDKRGELERTRARVAVWGPVPEAAREAVRTEARAELVDLRAVPPEAAEVEARKLIAAKKWGGAGRLPGHLQQGPPPFAPDQRTTGWISW